MKEVDYPVTIKVETVVQPSEDEEKVKKAVTNIFGILDFKKSEDNISGGTEDYRALHKFAEQTRSRKRLAALGRLLIRHKEGASTWVYMNKQAASVGVVSICEESNESPLGPIKLTLTSERIDDLIRELSSF